MHTISKVWLFCLLLAMSTAASANLTIEITRGSDQALPIGVVPFEGAEGMPEDVAQIIHDNLERSGFFDPLDRSSMFEQPSEADDVEFSSWRSLDVRYLVVGQAERTDSGYRIQYDLMDISGQTRMMSETVTASEGDLRGAAHYISDQIFEEITDIRGAFSTRIAYVTAQGVGIIRTTVSMLPMPTGATASRYSPPTSRFYRPPGRRMAASSPMCPSKTASRKSIFRK